MYFPILRGRQNELLAVRELISENVLSKKIIPIIEPVTLSSTFINFLEFIGDNTNYSFGIVVNPTNGDVLSELEKTESAEDYDTIIHNLPNVYPAFILNDNNTNFLDILSSSTGYTNKKLYICNMSNVNDVGAFSNSVFNQNLNSSFLLRLSRFSLRFDHEKILLSDYFLERIKKNQNIEYEENVEKVLNEDIDYYKDDGFIGFSDYSIIGDEFKDSGFLPKAVVIHFVYYEKGKGLLLRHFKSDSNEDNKDPANKFGEAVEKLVKWNNERGNNKIKTLAMQKFEELYNNKQYPGLGYIKKLSIMNHLEIVSKVLDSEDSD